MNPEEYQKRIENIQNLVNKTFLENPKEPINTDYVSFITEETIEALNQQYETDPSLYINLQTLEKLSQSRLTLLNKDLLSNSLVQALDISQSFTEQFQKNPQLIPSETITKLQPLITQKVNAEFLENPNQIINQEYIGLISPETLAKISKKQKINPQTLAELSVQQLLVLDPSILADYIMSTVGTDFSVPLEQKLSDNFKRLLTPEKDSPYDAKINAIDALIAEKMKKKINAEFAKNPTMTLDLSYVPDLSVETVQKLGGKTTWLQPNVIEAMSQEQLNALPQEIILQYLLDKVDFTQSWHKQKFPGKIKEWMQTNGKSIEQEFSEKILKKLNDEISKDIGIALDPYFLSFLTPENMKKFAEYKAQTVNLEQSLTANPILTEYQKNNDFQKTFVAKLKEKINRSFSKNPDWQLDTSYVQYIDIGTIKNLKLSDTQTINLDIVFNMNQKQIEALQPAILQKITLNQVKDLNLDNLNVTQFNALLDTNNQKIILYIVQNITFSEDFKDSPDTAKRIQDFCLDLTSEQLEELKTDAKDPNIKQLSEEILKHRDATNKHVFAL